MKQVARWFSLENGGIGTDFKVPEGSIYYVEGNISTSVDYDDTTEALTYGIMKGAEVKMQGWIQIKKQESRYIKIPFGYVTSNDIIYFDVPPNMNATIEIYREI